MHHYFCHCCNGEVNPKLPEYICPTCDSGFIEEVPENSNLLEDVPNNRVVVDDTVPVLPTPTDVIRMFREIVAGLGLPVTAGIHVMPIGGRRPGGGHPHHHPPPAENRCTRPVEGSEQQVRPVGTIPNPTAVVGSPPLSSSSSSSCRPPGGRAGEASAENRPQANLEGNIQNIILPVLVASGIFGTNPNPPLGGTRPPGGREPPSTAGNHPAPVEMNMHQLISNVMGLFAGSAPQYDWANPGANPEATTGSSSNFMWTPLLHSNLGDYVFGQGGLDAILTMLLDRFENTGPPPAEKDKISTLPTVNISQEQVDCNLECPVCKEDFKVDEAVRHMPCNHYFHSDCIVPWLEMHDTCPVCRKGINGDGNGSGQKPHP